MRPFLQHSFKQLESEFQKANASCDVATLEHLRAELNSRTRNFQTPVLKAAVTAALDALEANDLHSIQIQPKPVAIKSSHSANSGRGKPSLKPTDEQIDAIDAFKLGKHLKINAFAGSGKTSTLQLLAHETKSNGQYIAFNRYIVADAKEKFPSSVVSSTSHSLAMRATPSQYREKRNKLTGKVTANQMVELMELKHRKFGEHLVIAPRSQAFLFLETIRRYAQSGDDDLAIEHVPAHGSMQSAPEQTVAAVKDFALRGARHLWAKMLDPNDDVPLGHDGYLKLWGLSRPKILADYILLDEAQDTNPVVLDVLKRQSAQMIYVGDRYQQIYEWRGAVNAMEEITAQHDAYLTTSFRFGPEVARIATSILKMLGEERSLIGNPRVASKLVSEGRCDAILARTNSSTISAVIDALAGNLKPHLVGGTKELMDLLRGVECLKTGQPCDVPDFFGFSSWKDVVDFAKSDEGGHLLTFVTLVEARGERQLMWALNRTVGEDLADITISTAHKAKGREWKSVSLMDDFVRSVPGRQDIIPEPADLRLVYVALTRAKETILVPNSVQNLLSIEMPASTQPTRLADVITISHSSLEPRSPPNSVGPKIAPTPDSVPQDSPSTAQPRQPTTTVNMPRKKIGFWQRLFGV